jgi:hypothetical protein
MSILGLLACCSQVQQQNFSGFGQHPQRGLPQSHLLYDRLHLEQPGGGSSQQVLQGHERVGPQLAKHLEELCLPGTITDMRLKIAI